MSAPNLKTAVQAAASSPLVPPPPPPPALPDFALPLETVTERAATVGTYDPTGIATRNLQREYRAKLDWLMTWKPAEAAAIRQEQFDIQERAILNTKRLVIVAEVGRDLESAILRCADHRLELANVTAQLNHAKSTLASPEALALPDGELLRLKLETEHLPAKLAEIETKITASAEKVEKLVKASGCDREKFLAEMLRDGQAARLHAHGHLKL